MASRDMNESRKWRPDEFADARRRYIGGESAADIAVALDRTESSVAVMLSRRGVKRPDQVDEFTRANAISLARQGLTIGRICLKTGLDRDLAEALLAYYGARAMTIQSYRGADARRAAR